MKKEMKENNKNTITSKVQITKYCNSLHKSACNKCCPNWILNTSLEKVFKCISFKNEFITWEFQDS